MKLLFILRPQLQEIFCLVTIIYHLTYGTKVNGVIRKQ